MALVNMVTGTDVLHDENCDLINKAKILVIGAGGIGCEILKNLALSGFKDIEIIDLDTIDVSNLNRQFLFRKEHVGKSKAIVARDSIISFNPTIKINAFHDSITSPDYGIDYFQKFAVVLNALDNRSARNHVNRLCLAADVPLIESGTAGYSGQVELIKKDLTQCYECQLKEPIKTFPGCTIRNTPSEPVHCVVWSKHLFNQLFGEEDADQDVSPDTADPEAVDKDASTVEMNSGVLERKSTRMWAQECQYDPKKLFNKFFTTDIEYLLTMDNLWKNRQAPTPLSWDEAASHEGDLVDDNDDNVNKLNMQIWPLNKCVRVFSSTIELFKNELPSKKFLVWDKDDKSSLDFVTACTNIRAHIFSITKKSRFDIKSIAGNIIPAIATSNAIVAGIAVLMAFRVLAKDYHRCPPIYMRPCSQYTNNMIMSERACIPPNPNCYVCSPQPYIKVYVNTQAMLVREFESDILKKELNMIAPDVVLDGKACIIISSDDEETGMNEKILSEVGIVDGSILKVDDFVQIYKVTLIVNHYVGTGKDPLYKVDVFDKPLKTMSDKKESPTKQSGSKRKLEVLDVYDPLEGPSTKKHGPPADDDLIMLDEPLN